MRAKKRGPSVRDVKVKEREAAATRAHTRRALAPMTLTFSIKDILCSLEKERSARAATCEALKVINTVQLDKIDLSETQMNRFRH